MAIDEKNIDHSAVFVERLEYMVNFLTDGNVTKFARNAHIPKSTVQSWLYKKALPGRKHFDRLKEYTGKDEDYFFPSEKKLDKNQQNSYKTALKKDDYVSMVSKSTEQVDKDASEIIQAATGGSSAMADELFDSFPHLKYFLAALKDQNYNVARLMIEELAKTLPEEDNIQIKKKP